MLPVFVRRAVLVIFLILVVMVTWIFKIRHPHHSTTREIPGNEVPVSAASEEARELPPGVPALADLETDGVGPGPRVQQAFQFVLDGDRLDLKAVEEIRGDFHRRRAPVSWHPGMLYGRLMDGSQRVLAEETLAAPDATCVVLDPHLANVAGESQPTRFTAEGPVMFQFRMPKVESATHLKVYRLGGSQPAAANEEPVGQLLATISVAP